MPDLEQPIEHKLKTHLEQFQAHIDDRKTFEWRLNDRNYKVGDYLLLQEYDPNEDIPYKQRYTGRELRVKVTYILQSAFGVPDGYCVLSVKK